MSLLDGQDNKPNPLFEHSILIANLLIFSVVEFIRQSSGTRSPNVFGLLGATCGAMLILGGILIAFYFFIRRIAPNTWLLWFFGFALMWFAFLYVRFIFQGRAF